MQSVPVVDTNQNPLMPTSANRARSWIKSRKATPFWKRGVFCVRLNITPSGRNVQPIAVGIDPGSKKEGYSVKSESHTYLNIQADAVTWVKEAVKTRTILRSCRRRRKTPYRKCRRNRRGRNLPPSTKARWQWKLRIVNWLKKIYPITCFVVEDIKATTWKGAKKWNSSFSPLEVGKNWFYTELAKLGRVETKLGYETAQLRKTYSLNKSNNKLSETFEAHCVDSWVLANWFTGGHVKPDNKRIRCISSIRVYRRQLHYQNPEEGGIRRRYGGTLSLGFVKRSLVKYFKQSASWGKKLYEGLAYVSGNSRGCITLCNITTGKPMVTDFKQKHLKFLSYNTWKVRELLN